MTPRTPLTTAPPSFPVTDFSSMLPSEAMRVTTWMDDVPKRTGNWRINNFEITEQDENVEQLRAVLGAQQSERLIGSFHPLRAVPQGRYTAIYKRRDPEEAKRDGDPVWQPVMSDTPNELEDHSTFLDFAEGRVLVHGLGLGCIVAGLLAKPEVEHIDVVEIDAEVIELTGGYYAQHDDRVTIHHGDVMTYPWPRGTRWDCAWHDIWFLISPSNLTDDSLAEHGISYQSVHRKFANRVGFQMSWAFEHARTMRDNQRKEERYAERFVERFNASVPEHRLEMLITHFARRHGVEPHQWKALLFPTDEMREAMRRTKATVEAQGGTYAGGDPDTDSFQEKAYRRLAEQTLTVGEAITILFES